jgi:hypothetical protein
MKLRTFVKKENGLIKSEQISCEESVPGLDKIPDSDDLKSLQGEELENANALISEFKDYQKGQGKYKPENLESVKNLRTQSIEKGGFGTFGEQMELIYDKIKKEGMSPHNAILAWVKHIDIVKQRFPKREVD